MSIKLLKITCTLFSSLLLLGCGGGASDGTSNARYEGKWGQDCENVADSNQSGLFTLNIEGAKATFDIETYAEQNCSGSTIENVQLVYALDFVGTQDPSTGVCEVDDKVNSELNKVKRNDISLSGLLLDIAKDRYAIAGGFPEYLLLCVNVDGDKLYLPNLSSGNGETESTRPTEINDIGSISKI